MKIIVNKNDRSNILFYISYGLFLIFSVLQTSFYAVYVEGIVEYVLLLCGILLLLNELLNMPQYSLISIIWLFALSLTSALLAIKGLGVREIIYVLLFIYFGRNVDFKSIARFTILIESIIVSFVLFSAFSGMITNYVSKRASGKIRYFCGFLYVLYPSLYIFNITALSLYLDGINIKWKKLLCLFGLNWLIYIPTNGRLSFYLSILILFISVFLKLNPHFFDNKKIWLYLSSLIFFICCFLSVYISVTYDNSNQWMRALNTILGNRIFLSKNALLQYGYSLFGQEVKFYGYGLSSEGKQAAGAYNYVDNMYMRILIKDGMLFLLLYLYIHTLALIRSYKTHDYFLFFFLIVLAFHSLVDDLALQLPYNTFWFIIASLVFGQKRKQKAKYSIKR